MTSTSLLSASWIAPMRKEKKTAILITPREREVLHLIAYEFSTKQIASKLFVSYETISTHRQNLMRKLNVKNTAGLVRVAFEQALLTLHHQD